MAGVTALAAEHSFRLDWDDFKFAAQEMGNDEFMATSGGKVAPDCICVMAGGEADLGKDDNQMLDGYTCACAPFSGGKRGDNERPGSCLIMGGDWSNAMTVHALSHDLPLDLERQSGLYWKTHFQARVV